MSQFNVKRHRNPRVSTGAFTIGQIMEKCECLFIGKTIVKTEFGYFRSEMCKDFTAGKECKFGPQCHYAHGLAEICPKPYDDFKFKVKQCTCQNRFTEAYDRIRFLEHCNYGGRCEWRHDEMVYVLKHKNKSSIISIYYSPEEDRYRISLKPEPYESKIYVISLVRPNEPDALFEEFRTYFEAARQIVPPQNPCEYFNGLHTQSKCRIVELETIGTSQIGTPSSAQMFPHPPAQPMNFQQQAPQPLLNFQQPAPYVFPSVLATPPGNPHGMSFFSPYMYQNPPMHMMAPQFMNANTIPMNPPTMTGYVQVPDEASFRLCYNPDSNMSDFSWGVAESQTGESFGDLEPMNTQNDHMETGETPPPVFCSTPEASPLSQRQSFLSTPSRSNPPPGYQAEQRFKHRASGLGRMQ